MSLSIAQKPKQAQSREDDATQTPPPGSSPNLLPVTAAASAAAGPKKLTLIPLIFLIYFEVAGGPYGEEPAVKAAGPLFALLGFLIFPFIWSVPEALITAELSTAFPGDGGFVIWAHRAFGPFFGSLMGSWKFLSGVMNIASFPVLCIDYLKRVIHALESGWPRSVAIMASTCFLSFLNYTGLSIVGYVAVLLGIVSLLPFIIMSLIAIPKIRPHRWVSLGMANLGILPKFFAVRSKWFDTPWVGILLSTLITLGASHMDFTSIISSANFLYSLGMFLEFASFLWLRRKLPQLLRPYRVPLSLPGLVLMCLIPSGFLVVILAIATKTVYLVSGLMTVAAIGWYFLMNFCKAKNVFKFSDAGEIEE